MPDYLNSADELKDVFKIDAISSIYKNFNLLHDRKAGFSVEREYPERFKFKPPIDRAGKPDVVALIHVVYAHPEDFGNRRVNERVPVYLRVDSYSRYLSTHRDYNYIDPDCPTKDSVSASDSTPRPMDVIEIDKYYYDHREDRLEDKKGRSISGESILDDIFIEHCKTVRRRTRLKVSIIRRSRGIRINISGKAITVLKYLLEKLFGRKLVTKDGFSGTLTPYKKDEIEMAKSEVIDVLGYKASKNVILTFCFLAIIVFSLSYFFRTKDSFVTYMTSNNLIIICIAITSIWMLDYVIPQLFFGLINNLLRLKKKLLFKNIKV